MEGNNASGSSRVRPSIGPHAFVFIASFSLMVVEIVAGRIMAPYLGASVYTWTSVIGVVLTGVAAGNWCGGILAEKGATRKTLGLVFLLAGFAAAASRYMADMLGAITPGSLRMVQLENLLFALFVFFPVSFLLSLVTPIVVTTSITSLKKTGTTIGRLYAISAIASILGTFITGFVLISFIGVNLIMLMVAAVLGLTGIIAARDKSITVSAMTFGLLGMLWAGLLIPSMCDDETAYYCLRLEPWVSQDLGEGTRLKLDRLVHSFLYDDPRKLEYEYETAYATAAEYVDERLEGAPLRALFIGGGGYTMPRYLADRFPSSQLTVAEIDPDVTKFVLRRFGLDPAGPIKTSNEDARMFLMRHAEGKTYDLIFGDAFNDFAIPYHLTTVEFNRMVNDHLSPHGIYAINIIDDFHSGGVISSFMKTLGQVFPHLEVMTEEADWRHSGRRTYVVIASQEAIPQDAWQKAARGVYAVTKRHARIGPGAAIETFLSEDDKKEITARNSLTLTDDYAPVDNLVAPVFQYRN